MTKTGAYPWCTIRPSSCKPPGHGGQTEREQLLCLKLPPVAKKLSRQGLGYPRPRVPRAREQALRVPHMFIGGLEPCCASCPLLLQWILTKRAFPLGIFLRQ